jgi:DNA (cytosine-5)-methyltransferase 1
MEFVGGYLARYALSRLVLLDYQARLGMIVTECYRMSQFLYERVPLGDLSSVVCYLSCR